MDASTAPSVIPDIARIVRESRAAQGLPPTIEDPAVIRRIAVLLGYVDATYQRPAA